MKQSSFKEAKPPLKTVVSSFSPFLPYQGNCIHQDTGFRPGFEVPPLTDGHTVLTEVLTDGHSVQLDALSRV